MLAKPCSGWMTEKYTGTWVSQCQDENMIKGMYMYCTVHEYCNITTQCWFTLLSVETKTWYQVSVPLRDRWSGRQDSSGHLSAALYSAALARLCPPVAGDRA